MTTRNGCNNGIFWDMQISHCCRLYGCNGGGFRINSRSLLQLKGVVRFVDGQVGSNIIGPGKVSLSLLFRSISTM